MNAFWKYCCAMAALPVYNSIQQVNYFSKIYFHNKYYLQKYGTHLTFRVLQYFKTHQSFIDNLPQLPHNKNGSSPRQY